MRAMTFDGGGVLGIGPARWLECYEWKSGKPAYKLADAYAGTSTGAILASALAFHLSATEVVQLYQAEAPAIFKKRNVLARLNSHTYAQKPLREALLRVFGELTLGESPAPILITAADFRGNDEDGITDFYTDISHPSLHVVEAILRSTAAPTYFPPIDSRYADGGLFANNPSMALLSYLHARGVDREKVRLLSFGTGGKYWAPKKLTTSTLGIAKPLLQYLLAAGTARVIHRYCKDAGLAWYHRIAPEERSPEMDDLKGMANWRAIWESEWHLNGATLIKGMQS